MSTLVNSIEEEILPANSDAVEQPTNVDQNLDKKYQNDLDEARAPRTPDEDEMIRCWEKEVDALLEMMKSQNSGLSIRDRFWRFRRYKMCFIGSEFVTWLVNKNIKLSRQEAVDYGQQLMDKHVLHHVCSSEPFRDGEFYYRLQLDEETDGCLNMSKISLGTKSKPAPVATEIVIQIRDILSKIYAKTLTEKGSKVRYDLLKNSEEFTKDFMESVYLLQRVDLTTLNHNDKLAFWINIYNALVLHGFIANGPPQNAVQRNNFFYRTKYQIAGHMYSLNDIEHGILRGNSVPPGAVLRLIRGHDPRRIHVFYRVDPRIHFALNCGARSCPPIKVYTSEKIDRQLTIAAINFLDSETQVNESTNTVTLSKIMYWYYSDFADNDVDLLKFISQYITEEDKKEPLLRMLNEAPHKIKVNFAPYDWSHNFA